MLICQPTNQCYLQEKYTLSHLEENAKRQMRIDTTQHHPHEGIGPKKGKKPRRETTNNKTYPHTSQEFTDVKN